MARQIKYIIVWLAGVVLFNLICFLPALETERTSDHSNSFWVIYGLVMFAFVLHLIFSCVALAEKNKEKRILNTPIMFICTMDLCLMVVAGIVCMAVSAIPGWLGIILCYALLFLFVLFFLGAKTVGETTAVANHELNRKTYSFRFFTDRAEELISLADTPETKQIAQSVYDKIRYSDMVSDPRLVNEETMINNKLDELYTGFQNKTDVQRLQQTANDLNMLVDRRNNKCKTLKRQVTS